MPTRIPRPDPPNYQHAAEPLTDDQVIEQYGPLLDRFYTALFEDVGLLADIGRDATKIGKRHDNEEARAARYRQAKAEREAAVSR